MKKTLFYSFAAVASLAMVSCSQDDLGGSANIPAGEEATVTLAVSVPGAIQGRSFSDGKTATTLEWALYDITGGGFTRIKVVNDDTIELRKQMTLQLVSGHSYGVVFFAHAAEAPYTVTMDATGAKVEVDYSAVNANDESLDAFYAYETFDVAGNTSLDVKLYRPFAQINVGTNDYDDAKALRYEPEESAITVTDVYTEFDLLTGAVSGTTEDVDFAFTAIPASEDFPVIPYDYLAMTYVLVPEDHQLVEVTFKYKDNTESEADAKTRTVTNVPVRRNYRTNIYGQILTSNVTPTVHIEPAYNEPAYELDAIYMAVAAGGSVTLNEDLTINTELRVKKDLVIDLNGHNLTFENNSNIVTAAIYANADVNVTIKGNGSIIGPDDQYAIWVNSPGATLTIEDATVIAGVPVYIGEKGGKVYIKGGWFESAEGGYNTYVLNCEDNAYKKGIANFFVTGGTFVEFDPMASEGDHDASGNPACFVVEGYHCNNTSMDGKRVYIVYAPDAALVGSNSEIAGAFKAGKEEIIFLPLEYYSYNLDATVDGVRIYDSGNLRWYTGLTPAQTLRAVGATFIGRYSPNFHGATVVGAAFDKGSDTHTAYGSFIGHFINCSWNGAVMCENSDGEATFDGCTFTNDDLTGMAFHLGGLNEGKKVVLNNCTINGRCDMGIKGTIVFNNCTLNMQGTEWNLYGGNYEFNNCTISDKDKIVQKAASNVKGL